VGDEGEWRKGGGARPVCLLVLREGKGRGGKGERKGKGERGREKEEKGRGGACPTNQKIVPALLAVYSGCAPSLS